MSEEGLSPTLHLYVDASHPLRPELTAQIFSKLPHVYYDYWGRLKKQGLDVPFAYLRIRRIGVGSIWADFVALGSAMQELYEHRELLGGFVTHLVDVLQIMVGLKQGRVNTEDRSLLAALSAPVAHDNARQVTLQVLGDNNTILVIDASNADRLGRYSNPAGRPPKNIEQLVPSKLHIDSGIKLAEDERLGWLTAISDKWYVRLDGSGTLIPAGHISRDQRLKYNKEYRVTGYAYYRDDVPFVFEVERFGQADA